MSEHREQIVLELVGLLQRAVGSLHRLVQFEVAQREGEERSQFLQQSQVVAGEAHGAVAADDEKGVYRIAGDVRGRARERDHDEAGAVDEPLHAAFIGDRGASTLSAQR